MMEQQIPDALGHRRSARLASGQNRVTACLYGFGEVLDIGRLADPFYAFNRNKLARFHTSYLAAADA